MEQTCYDAMALSLTMCEQGELICPSRFVLVLSAAAQPSHDEWVALARRVEALGYSSLLMPDRLIMSLAPWTALATAAAATTTLRIGSHVFANDYRHPAILAKEAATLDVLSTWAL